MAIEKGAVKAILRHDHDVVKERAGSRGLLILLATSQGSAYLKVMDEKGDRPFQILTRTSHHEHHRNQPYFR